MALSSAHAADVTFTESATYTDTQTYDNGSFGGGNGRIVTFNSGANYTFNGNLTMPLAWQHLILNSGASLNVTGTISADVSGLSLNGGILTAGGLQLHDSPFWAGTINDGKQSIEPGDSIINGSTIIASQSNANFITLAGGTGGANGWVANNLWLGNDGAILNSNGYDIGVTMALGNFSNQSGSLTKTGVGTLTLSANNSYAAGTTVNGGVLEIAGSSAGNSYIRGTVTVNNGAELRYTGGDGTGFGFNGGNKLDTININGGLVNSQGNMTHLWGATVNMTGGELRTNNGVSSPTGLRTEWSNSTVNTFASASAATISGRINLRGDGGYSAAVFDVANGTAATDLLVSAAVTEGIGSVGITKNGAGTMELSGSNSYTGATRVTAGALVVNGNISTSTLTTVDSGATLMGAGTVGATTVNGILAPGNSIGTISVLGTLDLNGTSNFEIDPTTGLGLNRAADLASVTGAVSFGGILNVLYGGDAANFTNGMTFNLFDATLGFSDAFTAVNLPSLTGELTWRNDLATMGSITVVPEPGAALLGGLGFLALLRRRR